MITLIIIIGIIIITIISVIAVTKIYGIFVFLWFFIQINVDRCSFHFHKFLFVYFLLLFSYHSFEFIVNQGCLHAQKYEL